MTLAAIPNVQVFDAPDSGAGEFAGPLLGAVLDVDRANAEVVKSFNLQDWAKRLSALAIESGRLAIHGASGVGEQLVGAMALTEPRLEVWRPGAMRPVLVVDGWVTSTAGVSLVRHRLAALGVSDAHSVVIGIHPLAATSTEPSPTVTVLEP
jgi:hypothetical protein